MNQENSKDLFDLTVKQNRNIKKSSRNHARVIGAIVALLLVTIQINAVWAAPVAPPIYTPNYPAGAGIYNVVGYGANGADDVDDTAAIQNAIHAAKGSDKRGTVYFPNGTYIVSDTLKVVLQAPDQTSPDRFGPAGGILLGESRNGVIIKLQDNAPGFTDPAVPKPVINTAHGVTYTNTAFYNTIMNLTVDTGKNNVGAIGIQYHASNIGRLADVTVRSSDDTRRGAIGIQIGRLVGGPGPALMKHLEVVGFDVGIAVSSFEVSMTMEHLVLREQRVVGLSNRFNVISIHDLSSDQSYRRVPAVRQIDSNQSMITLVDATLTGGSSSVPAIDNQIGYLFARNIVTSGYQAAIKNGSTVLPGATVQEYVSDGSYSLFANSPRRSLNLAIEETPNLPWDPSSSWVNVTDMAFGATKNDATDDDSVGIQRAIDSTVASGKTTIYFPRGRYKIDNPIIVRGNVKRIAGVWSQLDVGAALRASSNGMFKIVDGSQPTVFIDSFFLSGGNRADLSYLYAIEHASPRTVVMQDIYVNKGRSYFSTDVGKLFIENVHNTDDFQPGGAPTWKFNAGQKVWARQLNPEHITTKVQNNGGQLWILGIKTEQTGTIIETRAGGKTELLGGFVFPIKVPPTDQPAFINHESQVSLVMGEQKAKPEHGLFNVIVSETRNGETKLLMDANVTTRRNESFVVPLYTGYVRATAPVDFDGDGKTDVAVYRPSAGVWHQLASGSNFAYSALQFGTSSDKLAPADYDGDGKIDHAVYRQSNGTWYVQGSSSGFTAFRWGVAEDKPVPADYDGDGKADFAVYRPSTGVWFIYRSLDNTVAITQFGVSEDVPTVGDYDGDGKADIALWRPSTGVWYSLRSTQGFVAATFGLSTDKPVTGDYDGDGRTDMAVWRPETGMWYVLRSSDGAAVSLGQFGVSTDVPTPGDYDGDGKADLAVFRGGTTSRFYAQQSSAGFLSLQFGLSTDKPVAAAYIR